MGSPVWKVMLLVESCGFVTNVVSNNVGGVTEPRSSSTGAVVVLWTAFVKAVGTVVSGAIVEVIFPVKSSALSLSVCSSGRCCSLAPMLGPAACAVPRSGWLCVAFCSGTFVLMGLLVNKVFVIELLV